MEVKKRGKDTFNINWIHREAFLFLIVTTTLMNKPFPHSFITNFVAISGNFRIKKRLAIYNLE